MSFISLGIFFTARAAKLRKGFARTSITKMQDYFFVRKRLKLMQTSLRILAVFTTFAVKN